jgi:ABC-type amino acid transport substrate-binding protein
VSARRWLVSMLALALALAVAAAPTPARAADKAITIAIYAPNAPFESGSDRFAYVNRLAQQVQSVAGVNAQGKAFAKAADLEAAIKAKQVDFAIIDGVYLAERNVPWPVLATATSGGDTAPRWALFTSTVANVTELQGKKLAFATSGPRDVAFLENALLDGELQLNKFFAARSTAPDITSAVAAASLKKADAVFAPESAGKGLKKVFDAGRVPNPALCEVGVGLDAALVAKVKSAVLAHGAAGPALDGWKAGGAEPYRALAGRMGARSRRPVMVEPDVVRIEDQDVLVPAALEAGAPDLKPLYWAPTP